jgi:hypothetical protein
MSNLKETPGCPKCGKPMEPKIPVKQALIEPNLGEPLREFECKECGHVEGRYAYS